MSKIEEKKKVVKTLQKAQKIISDRKTWTKGAYARNQKSDYVGVSSKTACKFCSIGALMKISEGQVFLEARGYLENSFDGRIAEGNDYPNTTHRQVMMAYDFAILMAKDDLEAEKK
jgi:hypothetical protein